MTTATNLDAQLAQWAAEAAKVLPEHKAEQAYNQLLVDLTTPRYRAVAEAYIYSQQGPALLRALTRLADSLIDSTLPDFDDPELEQALDEACELRRRLHNLLDLPNDYNAKGA